MENLPSSISYNSNREYRNHIRSIFKFKENVYSFFSDISHNISEDIDMDMDEETKDELSFDIFSMQSGLDIYYHLTEKEDAFSQLYLYAAGLFFSTDPKIGQVVLCSYDFFSKYYTCLWHFLNFKTINIPEYQQLLSMVKK
jgi:hypothetical protein